MQRIWSTAYGAFLGACCGDAAGATLEFFDGTIEALDVDRAVRMPGGGALNRGPGQLTDDSELALALAHGLAAHAPFEGFPLDAVAAEYHSWWLSDPKDIGNTCRNAFTLEAQEGAESSSSFGARMVDASRRLNATSEANGSLMRIVPLAIWASALSDDKLVEAAHQESMLSHPHQDCQDCNAVYCLLIAHLIRHPGDRQGALRKAEAFVVERVDSPVRAWFLTESLDVSELDCSKSAGHVRWAFILAVYHFRENSTFEEAICHTLLKGGDTDTNAAIVGGFMGALHGEAAIPGFMKTPVLAFDCSSPDASLKRPAAYRASEVEARTRALLDRTIVT